jgi:hypothetical protein
MFVNVHLPCGQAFSWLAIIRGSEMGARVRSRTWRYARASCALLAAASSVTGGACVHAYNYVPTFPRTLSFSCADSHFSQCFSFLSFSINSHDAFLFPLLFLSFLLFYFFPVFPFPLYVFPFSINPSQGIYIFITCIYFLCFFSLNFV